MSRKLLLLVLTLWRISDENLKSDYLPWKWHRNKMYTRFSCLSFGSIKLALLDCMKVLEHFYKNKASHFKQRQLNGILCHCFTSLVLFVPS